MVACRRTEELNLQGVMEVLVSKLNLLVSKLNNILLPKLNLVYTHTHRVWRRLQVDEDFVKVFFF